MMLNKKGEMKIYDPENNAITTYKDTYGIENYSYALTLGWKYAF